MFKSNKKSVRRSSSGATGTRRISIKKFIDITLIVLFVLSVVYIGSTVHKVTATVTEIESFPDEIVRLQLICSCKHKDILKTAKEYFNQINNNDFEIMVVDETCTELKELPYSVVISRDENLNHAKFISEIVDYNEEIIFRTLENNKNFITVTIVLGNDFEIMLEKLNSEKEI